MAGHVEHMNKEIGKRMRSNLKLAAANLTASGYTISDVWDLHW
jgi:hypothetical protein